jgi:hypothetical protein
MDPDALVLTPAEAAEAATESAAAVTAAAAATSAPATVHQCGIVGCRHGDHTAGVHQPDRQVKLECPACHAVARMTGSAIAKALTITCGRDGAAFVPADRRVYNRKGA